MVLALGGGKNGNLYVLDRDSMGMLGDANAVLLIPVGLPGTVNDDVIYATGAFWNNQFYLAGAGYPLNAYRLNVATVQFALASSSSAPSGGFPFPGATPSVSASGNTNGIVWALDTSQYCTNQSPGCGPAVLHAYDATHVATELWNSATLSSDAAGYAVKFSVPTIANGKVSMGTRGNNQGGANGSSSVSGELDVYGLRSP